MKKVTAKKLRKKDACERQVAIFEKRWPNGAYPTQNNIDEAVKLGLNVPWVFSKLRLGKKLRYEDSNGFWWERTYDKKGRELRYDSEAT